MRLPYNPATGATCSNDGRTVRMGPRTPRFALVIHKRFSSAVRQSRLRGSSGARDEVAVLCCFFRSLFAETASWKTPATNDRGSGGMHEAVGRRALRRPEPANGDRLNV